MPTKTFSFDTDEARGRVEVESGSYGLLIAVEISGEMKTVCLVDLYHPANEDEETGGPAGPPTLVIYDTNDSEEAVAYVRLHPEGTEVEFEAGVRETVGVAPGGRQAKVYSYPRGDQEKP